MWSVMRFHRINVGSIDYGIGVLRGVLGSDVRARLSDASIACIEQSIENTRAASRHVEHTQRDRRRKRR